MATKEQTKAEDVMVVVDNNDDGPVAVKEVKDVKPSMIDDRAPTEGELAFNNGGKSISELAHTLFSPTEYVAIKNIASVPVQWSYMPMIGGEEVSRDGEFRVTSGRRGYNDDRTRFIPGNEKYKMLEAGQTGIILGEGAYIAVEMIYKLYKMEKYEVAQAKRRANSKNVDVTGAAPSFADFLEVARDQIVVKKISPESMIR